MKSNPSHSAPLNLCPPTGVTGTTLADLPDRRMVWEMRVDGSFLRWCGTLEQFRKDCEEYCDCSKGHWEKVTNTEFRFISPEEPKITHFKAIKKGVDGVVESSAALPASPVKDTPAFGPNDKVRFLTKDETGQVRVEHIDYFKFYPQKRQELRAIRGEQWTLEAVAIAPASPVASVGVPESMFHFMER